MPGLYNKYEVWKDGLPVEGQYFVLKPSSDPAALAALRAYALETPDIELQNDLLQWIVEIEKAAELAQYPNAAYYVPPDDDASMEPDVDSPFDGWP